MTNLTHIKVGDRLAISRLHRSFVTAPAIKKHILLVGKVTTTQIVCTDGAKEYRVRRKDGHLVGGSSFDTAVEATQEMIKEHNLQVLAHNRLTAARRRCDPILLALNARKISVEAMEAIAHAYEKATKP